jgi:hypothetical protein
MANPQVTAALITASVSALVTVALGIWLAFFNRRAQSALEKLRSGLTEQSQSSIEKLKNELAQQKAERDAWLDYEYEARKRLYQEYEPLLFQLVELSEQALYRIYGFVRVASQGNLEPGPQGYLSLNSNYTDYYLLSTMYRLISPLAIYKLIRRRLTLFDLTVDSLINYQYRLAKYLYLSFSDDFDFARREPEIEYDPLVREWKKERIYNPAKYWRQGIPGGLLDNAVEALIVREPDGLLRLMSFGEFDTAYHQAESEAHKKFELVSDLFLDFHPRNRPVLWRILVTQAHIYMTLRCIREIKPARTDGGDMSGKAIPSTRQWESISDAERRSNYDWRQPGERGTHFDDEVLHQPFAVAQTYLQDKLGVTM